MAYVTPNSTIQLFTGLKLTKDSEDTLYFGGLSSQESYFGGLTPTWSASDFTFIGDKDSQKIRVAAPFATVMNCNYMRYKNTSYENKWMYCFIENVIHINDGCTEIEFTVDPLQTWLPGVDYNLKQCRIVRQHQTVSDNVGDNIQPENIQITTHHPLIVHSQRDQYVLPYQNGIYIAMMFPFESGSDDLFYIYNHSTVWEMPSLASTRKGCFFPAVQRIDGVPTGNMICLFDTSDSQDMANLAEANSVFGGFSLNTWVIPKDLVSSTYINSSWTLSTAKDYSTAQTKIDVKVLIYMNGLGSNGMPAIVGPINSNIIPFAQFYNLSTMEYNGSSYTVKNKKLFTNPFSFYEMEAANGSKQVYCFEDFNGTNAGEPTFQTVGSILGETFSIVPKNYNHHDFDYDKQVTMPQVPLGAFAGSNMEDLRQALTASIISVGTGAAAAATGGAATAVIGAAGSVGMTVNSANNTNTTSNINNLNNIGLWACLQKGIRGAQYYPENCKEIDDYFQAYGYTQNKFAVPSIHHRANWTYVQTDGANFTPVSIPAKYMKQINERFDKGVRFHKSASTIGNMDGYTNAISS